MRPCQRSLQPESRALLGDARWCELKARCDRLVAASCDHRPALRSLADRARSSWRPRVPFFRSECAPACSEPAGMFVSRRTLESGWRGRTRSCAFSTRGCDAASMGSGSTRAALAHTRAALDCTWAAADLLRVHAVQARSLPATAGARGRMSLDAAGRAPHADRGKLASLARSLPFPCTHARVEPLPVAADGGACLVQCCCMWLADWLGYVHVAGLDVMLW